MIGYRWVGRSSKIGYPIFSQFWSILLTWANSNFEPEFEKFTVKKGSKIGYPILLDLPTYPYPIISDFGKPTYLPNHRISFMDGPLYEWKISWKNISLDSKLFLFQKVMFKLFIWDIFLFSCKICLWMKYQNTKKCIICWGKHKEFLKLFDFKIACTTEVF